MKNIIAKIISLKENPGFKKYFLNTGWLMTDKLVRLFLGIFVSIWVARYLQPENFGILSFALSFVALFSTFNKLGLDNILVREVVNKPHHTYEILGTSFFLRIVATLGVLIVVYIVLITIPISNYERLIVMIIAIGQLFSSFEIINFFFQSKVQAKYSGLAGTFGLVGFSVIRITLIITEAKLHWFAIAVIAEPLIKSSLLVYYYFKSGYSFKKWTVSKIMAKQLLQYSWPLILSGVVISIYMRIDQIMLKLLLSNTEVGEYAAAVRLTEAWYFLPMVIANSLFPALLNARKTDINLFNSRFNKLIRFMFLLALTLAIPVSLLSNWIIHILYGSAYISADKVLSIHIWASVFVYTGVVINKWLIANNQQLHITVITGLGAITNVILNLVLIKPLGIMGAAIATLFSYSMASYFGLLIFPKTRGLFRQVNRSIFTLHTNNAKENS